jgi:ATP-binding cassette subfamily B protein
MKRKINWKTLGRTVKMLFGFYPVLMPITVVCILFSAACATLPGLFIQNVIEIIDNAQKSGIGWEEASKEVIPLMTLLATLYFLSLASITAHTQLMAYITQGFLCKMRRAMFDKMQNLPIKYFDTHKHGDIMSHYTNDIDTLRQLISQALPAIIQAGAVVTCVVGIMLYFSIWMTLVVMVGVCFMILVSKKVGGGSAKYYVSLQKSVAGLEGYAQEMMTGMRVVKIFGREEKCREEFFRDLVEWIGASAK